MNKSFPTPRKGGSDTMKQVALALLLAHGIVSALQAQPNGLTAELKLDQNQFLPNEDVQLKVRIANHSGQDLTLGQADDWITFSVQGADDAIVTKLGDVPAAGAFTLHSAQTGTRTFNLTPYFDFHRPGRYVLAATMKIAQWNQELPCKPVALTIVQGVRVPNVPEVAVGVLPLDGATNQPPEIRKFVLQKVNYTTESRLYLRLTDASGARTFRLLPIDRMLTFSEPEAQVDRFSNMHILNQTGAKSFCYCVVNARGQMLEKETYDYTQFRPTLRNGQDGRVFVSGGIRRFTNQDIPPND
jgi:hypothetical protein